VGCQKCGADKTAIASEHALEASSQKSIDIRSLKRSNFELGFRDYLRGISRLPALLFHFSILCYNFLVRNYDPSVLVTFLNRVNKTLNIHVKVLGMDKIRPANNATATVSDHGKHPPERKVVFVSNHVGFIDALILPRFIRSGVIASISAASTLFGTIFQRYAPTLVISRGNKLNTVDLMNRFMSEDSRHTSMYVFPQGLFAQIDTLTRFRSGAFATRHPVQPVVTRYRQDVSSLSMLESLCFPRVDVTVHVLDVMPREGVEATPAKDTDDAAAKARMYAERVRKHMAAHTSPPLLLSNVQSYDAVD